MLMMRLQITCMSSAAISCHVPADLVLKWAYAVLRSFRIKLWFPVWMMYETHVAVSLCVMMVVADPAPVLEHAQQIQKKAHRAQDLEVENQQLRGRLDEYNSEFAEVKNQGIRIVLLYICMRPSSILERCLYWHHVKEWLFSSRSALCQR